MKLVTWNVVHGGPGMALSGSWTASPRSLGFWEHMAIVPEILAKKQRWSGQDTHGPMISGMS